MLQALGRALLRPTPIIPVTHLSQCILPKNPSSSLSSLCKGPSQGLAGLLIHPRFETLVRVAPPPTPLIWSVVNAPLPGGSKRGRSSTTEGSETVLDTLVQDPGMVGFLRRVLGTILDSILLSIGSAAAVISIAGGSLVTPTQFMARIPPWVVLCGAIGMLSGGLTLDASSPTWLTDMTSESIIDVNPKWRKIAALAVPIGFGVMCSPLVVAVRLSTTGWISLALSLGCVVAGLITMVVISPRQEFGLVYGPSATITGFGIVCLGALSSLSKFGLISGFSVVWVMVEAGIGIMVTASILMLDLHLAIMAMEDGRPDVLGTAANVFLSVANMFLHLLVALLHLRGPSKEELLGEMDAVESRPSKRQRRRTFSSFPANSSRRVRSAPMTLCCGDCDAGLTCCNSPDVCDCYPDVTPLKGAHADFASAARIAQESNAKFHWLQFWK